MKTDMINALMKWVIKITQDENATSAELEAMAKVAPALIEMNALDTYSSFDKA